MGRRGRRVETGAVFWHKQGSFYCDIFLLGRGRRKEEREEIYEEGKKKGERGIEKEEEKIMKKR